FPTTANAYKPAFGGAIDMFAAVLTPDLRSLVYATFVGGTGYDVGETSTADGSGALIVAGEVRSTDWPTLNALQPSYGGGMSAAGVAKLITAPTPPPSPMCAAVPKTGCKRAATHHSSVRLRDDGGARKKLVWSWRATGATVSEDFGDPVTSTR